MKKTNHGFAHYLTFKPTCVLEAGVGNLRDCRSSVFWGKARCVLFEPLPTFYRELAAATFKYDRIKLYPFALWEHNDGVEFVQRAQSSYVEGVVPRIDLTEAAASKTRRRVPSAQLKDFDRGDYDLVLLDMEAAEWKAIEQLQSRPKMISIEMWKKIPEYRHPDYDKIMQWLRANGYHEVGRDLRDSFFVR